MAVGQLQRVVDAQNTGRTSLTVLHIFAWGIQLHYVLLLSFYFGFLFFHAKRRMRIFRMRCATDHEPCRQNLATLESSFGGNIATLESNAVEAEEGQDKRSNNNLDDCAEALEMVKDHEMTEVIHMDANQSRVAYHKDDSPSSPSNHGSYFDDL